MTCPPETEPGGVRLLWDNHNLKGALFHEKLTIFSGAGSLCHGAGRVGHSGAPEADPSMPHEHRCPSPAGAHTVLLSRFPYLCLPTDINLFSETSGDASCHFADKVSI